MPLFESQSSRNDRLFGAVRDAAFKTIHEQFGDGPEASTHSSWVAGGMHLAKGAVDHLETLKNAWGKGSVESARSLTVLFALSMISRWYRAMRADRPVKDETRAVQIAATNILTLLGQEALGDIVDFVNLHSQFIYECDWVEGKTPVTGRRVELPEGTVEITPSESLYWGDVFQNPLAHDLDRELYDYVSKHLFKPQVEAFTMLGVRPTKERLGVISWGYHLADLPPLSVPRIITVPPPPTA